MTPVPRVYWVPEFFLRARTRANRVHRESTLEKALVPRVLRAKLRAGKHRLPTSRTPVNTKVEMNLKLALEFTKDDKVNSPVSTETINWHYK